MITLPFCMLVAGALASGLNDSTAADDARAAGANSVARFAAPVRLAAGEVMLGAKRRYPSPAVRDWNGDGRLDVVIGDLKGTVTVAERQADGSLAAEVAVQRRDGEPLAFSNW